RLEQDHAHSSYRALFTASSDAICVIAADGRLTDANAAAVTLFGYTLEELKTFDANVLGASLADGAALTLAGATARELTLRCKDGSLLPCLVTCAARVGRVHQAIIHDLRVCKGFEA